MADEVDRIGLEFEFGEEHGGGFLVNVDVCGEKESYPSRSWD